MQMRMLNEKHINKYGVWCVCGCGVRHVKISVWLWIVSEKSIDIGMFSSLKIYMRLNKWKIDHEIRVLIGLRFHSFIVHETHMQTAEDLFKSTEREREREKNHLEKNKG